MKNVEIERKYLVHEKDLPKNLSNFSHARITQAFIYLKPAIRVRQYGDKFYFTVKSKPPKSLFKSLKIVNDDIARFEYEIEITKKVYTDLSKLACGRVISKMRYKIPYKKHIIELDIFDKELKGLIYAEVEFKSILDANKFIAPSWLYKDVTGIERYKNTQLCVCKNIKSLLKY